jgi:hypothetical protein
VLNLASNCLGELVLPEGWTEERKYLKGKWQDVFQDADGTKQSAHPGKPEGIIALANAIPDMGAISSVNILKNGIGTDQAKNLVDILKEHPTLKSLCGNTGNETELDMSGKMDGSWDAIMLIPEITNNVALISLSLASNRLGVEGAKIIAAVLPKCT